MAAQPLDQLVEPGWAEALRPVAGRISAMGGFLREEIAAGRTYLPAGEHILRAFQQPFDEVRVRSWVRTLTRPRAIRSASASPWRPTCSASRQPAEHLPRAAHRPRAARPSNGDLTPWTRQGVLLSTGSSPPLPASRAHARKGWEEVTEQAIKALAARAQAARRGPVGRDAATCARSSTPTRRSSRPTLADVRRPRLLRLPAVQPHQRPPDAPGRRAGRLAPPLTRRQRSRGSPDDRGPHAQHVRQVLRQQLPGVARRPRSRTPPRSGSRSRCPPDRRRRCSIASRSTVP